MVLGTSPEASVTGVAPEQVYKVLGLEDPRLCVLRLPYIKQGCWYSIKYKYFSFEDVLIKLLIVT